MSLDPATAFLIRKEKRALEKELKKGEKALTIIQARMNGKLGLLAATPVRLLFVRRGPFGSKTVQVPRKAVADLGLTQGKPVGIRVELTNGRRWELLEVQRGAAEQWMETVRPTPRVKTGKSQQVRKNGPMVFTPKAAVAKATKMRDGYDPLSSSPGDKLVRLERLKASGQISAAEYRWQKDALERS